MSDILFYGGLVCMGVSLLLLIILIPAFGVMRRKLIKRIENGEDI